MQSCFMHVALNPAPHFGQSDNLSEDEIDWLGACANRVPAPFEALLHFVCNRLFDCPLTLVSLLK